MQQNLRLNRVYIITSTFLFIIGLSILDILSKVYMKNILSNDKIINLIPNVLSLRYVENTGAAFSIFQQKTFLFVIISFIFLIGAFYLLVNNKLKSRLNLNIMILMTAGCIGNLYDRITLGYVRDFIEIDIFKFPVFNIADIYITFAAFLLLFKIITEKNHE